MLHHKSGLHRGPITRCMLYDAIRKKKCKLKTISEHNIGKRKRKIKKITLSGVGFEPTPPFGDQSTRSHCTMGRYYNLESGALDRSAILTDAGKTRLYFSCSEIARKENDWVLIIIPTQCSYMLQRVNVCFRKRSVLFC